MFLLIDSNNSFRRNRSVACALRKRRFLVLFIVGYFFQIVQIIVDRSKNILLQRSSPVGHVVGSSQDTGLLKQMLASNKQDHLSKFAQNTKVC